MSSGSSGGRKRSRRKPRNDNTAEVIMDVNEKILRSVYELYSRDGTGLNHIAKTLSVNILAPRKKVTVMIVGNHSAGKSSFINWYLQEHVQKTSVAIETMGFTLITHGKKRETLRGPATLELFPHLKGLAALPGVVETLQTEISVSAEHQFPLVTLIDTPGLTDGNLEYPFKVEEVIQFLSNHCDMVLIFLDPHQKALCQRTMNIVEILNKAIPEKMKFYMTRADEMPDGIDRQRVLVQITQGLTGRIRNMHAFDLPAIYIPDKARAIRPTVEETVDNAIEALCTDIENTINSVVQKNLNNLTKDSESLLFSLQIMEDKHKGIRWRNLRGWAFSYFFWMLQWMALPLFLAVFVAANFVQSDFMLGADAAVEHPQWYRWAAQSLDVSRYLQEAVDAKFGLSFTHALGVFGVAFLVLWLLVKLIGRQQPTLSSAELRALQQHRVFMTKEVEEAKKKLYNDFFSQVASREYD
eukprot:gnl/Hemi2/20995_TR6963_c0_g1_i1.p1 gnl/Hemi2/20995_TR6963_c0_g1~~gnl/Hemi2/20995_TR6963_c0_g1_i1.p1  ORF type:complete len:469 (+),score=129.52 gnl/Hemi2/20995_TR6963_c0_g1_i1:69-1475(+)